MTKIKYLKRKCKYLEEMNIGDYIPCGFKEISEDRGFFFDLGTCDLPEIPKYYPPSPRAEYSNGKFYFIKVDENTFLADRLVGRRLYYSTTCRHDDAGYGWYNLNGPVVFYQTPVIPYNLTNNTIEDFIIDSNIDKANAWKIFSKFSKIDQSSEKWNCNFGENKYGYVSIENNNGIIIRSFRIKRNHESDAGNYVMEKFKVEVSNGDGWLTIHEAENNALENKDVVVNLKSSIKYKKIRLVVYPKTQVYAGSPVYIHSFEIYDKEIRDSMYYVTLPTVGCFYLTNNNKYNIENQLNGKIYPINNQYDQYISDNNELWNFKDSMSFGKENFCHRGFKSKDSTNYNLNMPYIRGGDENGIINDLDVIYQEDINKNKIGYRPLLYTKHHKQIDFEF